VVAEEVRGKRRKAKRRRNTLGVRASRPEVDKGA
jgi:hypothetical protein